MKSQRSRSQLPYSTLNFATAELYRETLKRQKDTNNIPSLYNCPWCLLATVPYARLDPAQLLRSPEFGKVPIQIVRVSVFTTGSS